MRIISGKYKGRQFETPKSFVTHPMGDRVKVALFNTLSTRVEGAKVLDAYAGSGALGFECLSRGAKFVQFVEKDPKVADLIKRNSQEIGINLSDFHVSRANCASWAQNNMHEQFDLIIIDPPFDKLNLSTIEILIKLLSPEGLMVLSHTGREAAPTANGVVVVDNRMYGNAALSYYHKVENIDH